MNAVGCLRLLLLTVTVVAMSNAGSVYIENAESSVEMGNNGAGSNVVMTAATADTITIDGLNVLNITANLSFSGQPLPLPLPVGTRLQVGVDIPYQNSYQMYFSGATYEAISLNVQPNNVVTISGGFHGGPCSGNSVVFSVPAALRPAGDIDVRGVSFFGHCQFRLKASGDFVNVDCDNCGVTSTDWAFVRQFSYVSVG